MKFKIKLSFLLSIALVVCSLALVSSNKDKSTRAESMMEYLNGFFGTSNNGAATESQKAATKVSVKKEKSTHKKKHHSHKKHKNHFRFKERSGAWMTNGTNGTNATNSTNATAASNNTGGLIANVPETAAPILMEWFMISSPAFKNKLKFPPVRLSEEEELTIETDTEFFRINQAFGDAEGKDEPPNEKFFWFRLSGLNLYYSMTKTDINILGSVSVAGISSLLPSRGSAMEGNATYCFTVADETSSTWRVCGLVQETVTKWMCQIKLILGEEDPKCGMAKSGGPKAPVVKTEIVIRNITQPIIIIPLPSPQCNENWNYQKNGDNWECDCSEGREQSPIDLPKPDKTIDSPVKPLFQYDEVTAKNKVTTMDGQLKENEALKIKLMDNTLKILHNRFGKVVTMDGAVYFAQEIVIHTPSEHTIDGMEYDLEVQIIHYGQTKGDIAKQVILSFLFEKVPGVYNKFIDDLDIFNLPSPTSKERELLDNIFVPKILYSADSSDAVVMKPFSFYTYQGSLTTPPCTESTIVYVASKPLKIGSTAVKLFQESLRIPDMMNGKGQIVVSDWIPMSNRNTQPLNGRPIFHYDHQKNCGPDPIKQKPKPKGHYEKVMKASTDYFYVSDENPSGIPNAFVVSEKEALGK